MSLLNVLVLRQAVGRDHVGDQAGNLVVVGAHQSTQSGGKAVLRRDFERIGLLRPQRRVARLINAVAVIRLVSAGVAKSASEKKFVAGLLRGLVDEGRAR